MNNWGRAQRVSEEPVTRGARRSFRLRHLALSLLLAACGGATGKRMAGGESHFLETCDKGCPAGLACISGLCSRSCESTARDCSDLSPLASCVSQGETQLCDVSCDRDRDCVALGAEFRCPAGFCRVASVSDHPPSGAAGAGGEPAFQPFNPECAQPQPVMSECSFEQTCEQLQCGKGASQFGADGCTRYCKADADCGAGQRCWHTSLGLIHGECTPLGSVVEGCTLEGDQCVCGTTADCFYPSICVDAAEHPADLDCTIDGSDCAELADIEATIQDVVNEPSGAEEGQQATSCLARVKTRTTELDCPGRPFAPSCDPAIGFKSDCGFELTCEQLGCGDGFSQFDENGCTRYCKSDADCADGKRCRHTSLVLTEVDCPFLGRDVDDCSLVDGTCDCSITLDCPHPDICVDSGSYPESLDCAVEGASCLALQIGEENVRSYLERSLTPEDLSEGQACLDAIVAQRQTLACD
jgi:hypothetical protein